MNAIKIIGTIIVDCVVLVVGGCSIILGTMNHRNENYWKYTETKGEIESKYSALGTYEVSTAEWSADGKVWKEYEVWYPSDMKGSSGTYPLVIMANGTGIKASQYREVFRHLASWGFIVVGNEDENSRSGESSAATLDFMLGLNEDKSSDFYGKIDTENIGIAGHSQGGVGAINAVTQQKNGNKYKAICAQSTTSSAVAYALNLLDSELGGGWSCDTTALSIPAFMVAGTGSADAGNVNENRLELDEGETQGICPLWWLQECFDAMPDTTPKVIARLTGKDHGDIPHITDGYMTAWFMYWLKDDTEAGKAFFGENAEIFTNSNWQDVKVDGQGQ